MPDDFQDIRERMSAHDHAIQAFLLTVGATLIQCQAFEDRLRQYKVLVYETKPGMTCAEFETLLAKSRKKDTLGSLLKDLGKRVNVESKTQALLDEFLSERNWFIHHLEYQHNGVAFDPVALGAVIQRMRDIQRRSTHLQKEFVELAMSWTQQRQGVSREEIDATAREHLEQLFKRPGPTS